jgi:hypothetical protein
VLEVISAIKGKEKGPQEEGEAAPKSQKRGSGQGGGGRTGWFVC